METLAKIATVNLNYGRRPEGQADEVQHIDADVVCTQEDERGQHRERVQVKGHEVEVKDRGRYRANLTRLGYLIRLRWFAWALVRVEGIPFPFYVVSVHFPPLRMPGLYPLMARRLRRLLRRFGGRWVVGGDWNKSSAVDPAGLEELMGAQLVGHGIDHFAVSDALRPYVASVRAQEQRHPRDEHRVKILRLGKPA